MTSKERLKLILINLKAQDEVDMGLLDGLNESEKELVLHLYKEGLIEESLALLEELNIDEDWEILKKKIRSSGNPRVVRLAPFLKYAAIFIGLLVLGYFLKPNSQDKVGSREFLTSGERSIKLDLGNGNIKVINQGSVQQIFSPTGEVLGEQTGNTIRYKANSETDKLVYNELDVPNGKTFNLELSDGTFIHLNSGSRIKYPAAFLPGQKREVVINGEAYFKVAHDKERPFVVHADAVAIEVLGTEFNISSYPEDASINAVLVKGSISMSNVFVPEEDIILKPGSKGAWNKMSHQTEIEKVDVDLYTGWITGDLVFRNSSFENMIEKLERRYNVKIQNDNAQLNDKLFNARFNVEVESIEDVMKLISQIYPFSYRISGQQITIER